LSYAKTWIIAKHKGQGLVEYAIIVVAVVVIAILVRTVFWGAIQSLFTALSSNIANAANGPST
jgi:Flp pilus assembly pilin Flp